VLASRTYNTVPGNGQDLLQEIFANFVAVPSKSGQPILGELAIVLTKVGFEFALWGLIAQRIGPMRPIGPIRLTTDKLIS